MTWRLRPGSFLSRIGHTDDTNTRPTSEGAGRGEQLRVVEVIRGMNLGGAETLLVKRLNVVDEALREPLPDTTLINTAPQFSALVADLPQRVVYAPLSSGSVPSSLFATWRFAANLGDGDLVVCHSPGGGLGFKLRKVLGRRGYRIVDVVHTTRYKRVYLIASRILNRTVDRCVCVSSSVASAPTTDHYTDKVTVIGGVPRRGMRTWVEDHPDEAAVRRSQLGVSLSTPLIASLGNLTHNKNHVVVIEALAVPGLERAHYVLIGDGPMRTSLEQTARDLGVHERVHFLGRVHDGWKWASVADLLVHPSLYEGLPVALMEAAALGLPVVASKFGGISDLVEHGAAIRVSASDAISLAAALSQTLASTPSISVTWRDRAARASYWDIERYTYEFYSQIGLSTTDRHG